MILDMLDRHDCYELCVQSPRHVVALLRGAHSGEPTVLREDFAGTGSVSLRWLAEAKSRGEHARAMVVDLDGEALARARQSASVQQVTGLDVVQADCVAADDVRGADVIFVGNFSMGYIQTRAALVQYLRASKRRLDAGNAGFGGGIFACDLYGGPSAYRLGVLERKHPARGREMIHYVWRHEEADPRTARVRNSISFRVVLDGDVIAEMPRAFVYEWRLWSLVELTEAMHEAGFSEVALYKDLNVAPGQTPVAVASADELRDDWIVLVVGK
jgi:hypothetical protein